MLPKLAQGKHPRRQRRRLRSAALAPTLLTVGNLICGFAAIHFALRAMYDLGSGAPQAPLQPLHESLLERTLPPFLSVGAGLVILGMLFDMFDGLIARVTRSTTNFGGQLDSLADVVSFGVAPATLYVAFMSQELARESIFPSPISDHLAGRAVWVSAAIYVVFAAIRLARFNVEHARADFDYRTFRGLPSPGAACVLVAFILFHHEWGIRGQTVTLYLMPVVATALGFLMVSRIPYRRFHRTYLLGNKPFRQVITLLMLVAAFWLIKAPTLLLIVLWYAASGPIFYAYRMIRGRAHGMLAETDTPAEQQHRLRA